MHTDESSHIFRTSEFLQNIIESIQDGIAVIDTGERIRVLNSAMESFCGQSAERAYGKFFADVFPGNPRLVAHLRETIDTGMNLVDADGFFYHIHRRKPLPVSSVFSPIFDEHSKVCAVVLVIRDMSRIRELEENAHRTEKLAALGQIAAKIAHEIKNPLGGIKGSVQLLSRELEKTESREYTDVILQEVQRIDRIVSELLDFVRPKKLTYTSTNLHELIERIIVLLKHDKKSSGIQFVTLYDPSLPEIMVDPDKISQVLFNVFNNALEAISVEGEIRVTTEIVHISYVPHRNEGHMSTHMIKISVKDNGRGICEEDVNEVFAPFYTTKTSGSGMGLAISHGIIQEHHGIIRIQSQRERGTKVEIFLPLKQITHGDMK